jgi:hypothetical protein
MNLKELALHTRDIEYPGRTIDEAQAEADKRAWDANEKIRSLRRQIEALENEVHHTTHEYHDADRANELFKNALIECPEIDKESL